MPLLNLTPATGSRGSSNASYGSLEGLAERMTEKKRKEEEERRLKLERQTIEQARKADERKKEDERKAAEQRAKDRSVWGKVTNTVKDIFSADTAADKERRKAAGQPELYKDQQAQKKKTAEEFTKNAADEFDRGKALNFSKDEINKRRDFYKAKGVDLDQLISDQQAYKQLLAKYGGDTKKVAFARAKGKLSPEDKKLEAGAKRYQDTFDKAGKAETIYRRNQKAAAGAENVLEQAERGFVRGVAEPIIKTPANLQTALGAALQAVAPSGSRVDRAGKVVYEEGTENLDELARKIVNTGYGAQEADNPLVSGVSQGAGSLAASLSAVGAVGRTGAAAGMFGLEAGTEQLRASKEAGKGDIQSFATGAVAGTLEGLLEKVGLDKFLGVTGKPVKQAVTRMVTEGVQEATQSLAQSGVKLTYTDVDIGQAIQQALVEGGIGAIVGGGASLPMSIAQTLEAKGVDRDTAMEVGMNVQDRIAGVLDDSKVDIKPPAPVVPAKKVTQRKDELPDQFARRYVKEAPEQTQKDYDDRVKKEFGVSWPNIVSADEAKFIIPGFKTEHSGAYHEAASGLAKAHYKKLLADPETKSLDVLITGGGAGAGKSTGLMKLNEKGISLDDFAAVNDTNLTTKDSADIRIKPALESGRKVTIMYVYRDPVDAFVNGNIPRAKRTGRIVPIPAHVDTHADSLETIKQVAEEYKDDPRVTIQVVDNSRGKDKAKLVSVDFLKDKGYNKEELTRTLENELEQAKQQGNVTEEAYRTYKPRPSAVRSSVREKPQQKRKEREVEPKPKEQAPAKPTEKSKTKLSSRQSGLDALADYDSSVTKGRESLRTAEELTTLADQLNKAAQAGAILRRGDYKSKKNLGAFIRKKKKGKVLEEVIKLQDAIIKDPRMYATVLAHEMSHAIEYNINGDTKHTYKLFGELTDAEERQIDDELKQIVDEIEGADVANARADYFYKPTEMFARYIETLVLHPGKAEHLAPLVTEKFGQLVTSEPLVADFLLALDSSLDKGFKNYTPNFLKDMRQMYRRHLGKRAGDAAYNAEVIRRAEIQRSQGLIDKLVKRKFKGVKDDPALLFRAAEAIRVTKDEDPQFGTHDFTNAFTEKEQTDLEKARWEKIDGISEDGRDGFVYARERYTPEQAQQIFEKLSPEGQQLIKDFTAAKEEAKDEFNRDLLKELYHIDSKLEGWVHHYFEGKPMGGNKKTSLRTKVAGAKKQRKGAEGYIEDFRKATEKAMLELDAAEINNMFIAKQLARISKPIAKGDKPDKGWVEVVADGKGGMRLPGEGMQVIIKPDAGKAILIPQKRYQVPADLAQHYREIRDVPQEANLAAKALNRIAKYWTLNVLIHPGTVSTNFISGGLQYGAKIVNDFYMDVLSANFGMERTRSNLIAPLKVLTPRGWTNAPDWLYGGYRSTLPGQFATGEMDTKLDKGIEAYGNKMLKAFSMVETYWKKVIALSEGSKLAGVSNRKITQRLQKEEQQIVSTLNEAIDEYAFDYDNKPLWLSKFDRGGGKIVKPFMTYPYKLAKFYTNFAASGFDRSLPWQQRTAKVLTLATIVMFIALLYKDQEDESEVPKGTEKTPLSLKPGGRLFVGVDKEAKEAFVRTAKYPFFNLTSVGKAAAERNGGEIMDVLREQLGTVGPGVELFSLATGRTDQFSQYTPAGVRVADIVASFIPGFRLFNDAGAMIDEKGRSPKTFIQGIGSQLPIWGSEEQRTALRGKVRTIKIPDEPKEGRSIAGSARTVTTRDVTRSSEDVLLSLLTGIYIRRIDPKEAKQQELREIRDDAEEEIRKLLAQGQEADAETLGDEYGLEIPKSVYDYYRAKARKR